MRFAVNMIALNDGVLGYDYRYHLSSLIYKVLASASEDYCAFLHEVGFENRGHHFRLFTFSDLRSIVPIHWTPQGMSYHAGDLFEWQVSSPVEQFICELAQGLFCVNDPFIGTMQVRFADVHVESHPPSTNKEKFRTLSPITMSTHDEQQRKHYLTPGEEWSGPITRNLMHKLEALTGKQSKGAVTLKFDEAYIAKRTAERKPITKLCAYKQIKVRAVAAPFIVEGDPELIAMGYEAGFGDANPAGFGMVDYVAQKEANL